MVAHVALPKLPAPKPEGLALLLGWRRLLVALAASTIMGLIVSPSFATTPTVEVLGRYVSVGLAAMLVYGIFEQWPTRLPSWLARWALQVMAVVVTMPLAALAVYLFVWRGEPAPFWTNPLRLNGFMTLTLCGLLLGPWIAVAALFRELDFLARRQAMAFELERSELERKALDSRLRLLQAQVEPHFLFNTLANVRELVDSGSAQASRVLDSLIAYLRAAVPRLHDPATTVGQEVQLVRAYLELMHLRMPDRLQFALEVEPAAIGLRCPPTTLLTLVENAVRHGIDPSEDGGRIDVSIEVRDGRCRARVRDTGVGLGNAALGRGGVGLGTGLETLRERLQLAFGGDATVAIAPREPRGVCAEADFPAQRGDS